jgi:hypothetical protein
MFDQFEMNFIRAEEGVRVYVLFSYMPGQGRTWWEPGWEEEVEILEAYLDDGLPVELTDSEREWLIPDALREAKVLIAEQLGPEPEPYAQEHYPF